MYSLSKSVVYTEVLGGKLMQRGKLAALNSYIRKEKQTKNWSPKFPD